MSALPITAAGLPLPPTGFEAPAPLPFSLVIPCYNEAGAIEATVRHLDTLLASHFDPASFEIIVVDDGSTDGSGAILTALAIELPHLLVLRHEQNIGYGASLKTAIRRARGHRIAITDADGTYPHDRMPDLLTTPGTMVVGARVGDDVNYSRLRAVPKLFLRRYAQWITRRTIPDINSGMRVFDRALAMRHFHLFPDGFSFTTTITMAALMEEADVRFLPISYAHRVGSSKIAPIRDTLRFILLISRTGMYFAPLRILGPVVVTAWLLTIASLVHDLWALDFNDLSVLLLSLALNLTTLALVADMLRRRTER